MSKLSALHPIALIATWFGTGRVPKIHGTVGSLAALPFAYAIQHCFGNYVLLAAAFAAFIIGCRLAEVYCERTGQIGADPREVVIDEVAGMWLLLSMFTPEVISYVMGFVLFRLFDIFKPWPISLVNRQIKDGFGIMLDDILAALYPVILLFILKVVLIFSVGEASVPYLKLFLPAENVE